MKRWFSGSTALLLLLTFAGSKQEAQSRAPKGVLRHTVAFNFKPDVSQETIDRVLADARATLVTIEGTTNIVVGPQTSNFTKYKYGISIDFVNREADANYDKSPQGKRMREQYRQFIEDQVVIDILSQ